MFENFGFVKGVLRADRHYSAQTGPVLDLAFLSMSAAAAINRPEALSTSSRVLRTLIPCDPAYKSDTERYGGLGAIRKLRRSAALFSDIGSYSTARTVSSDSNCVKNTENPGHSCCTNERKLAGSILQYRRQKSSKVPLR